MIAPITITQIDLNSAAASGTLDILTIPGTRAGNQTNVAAWTGPSSLGNPITTLGAGAPSPCTLATPLTLAPGTYGMAFRANGFAHYYTNGTGANQNYATAELTLAAGEASNTAFAGNLFTPRVVNCSIHYTLSGGNFATRTNYGTGCPVPCPASIYENFGSAGAFDLNGTSILQIGTTFIGGTTAFVAPGASAAVLPLIDDSEVTITLGNPHPLPCSGVATTLQVCSNGFISTASNGVSFTPSVPGMLNAPNTGWWNHHDFNPAAGGTVTHEIIGTDDVISWNAVADFGGGGFSTWQVVFSSSGTVEWRFQSMSATGGSGYVLGYSPGGANVDPGSTDYTVGLPKTLCCSDIPAVPLALNASARPVIGTNVSLVTSGIPAGSPFGAVLFGLTQFNPGIPLSLAPGCVQHNEWLNSILFFGSPTLPTSVTTNAGFFNPVVNFPGLVLQCQSAVYTPGGPGLGLSSNGVEMKIDIN